MSSKTPMTSKIIDNIGSLGGTSGLTSTIVSFIRLIIILLIIIALLFLFFSGGIVSTYAIGVLLILLLITFFIITNQANLGGLYSLSFIVPLWTIIVGLAVFILKPLMKEAQQSTIQNIAMWMVGLMFISIVLPSFFTTIGDVTQFIFKHAGFLLQLIIGIAVFITLLGISLSWSFFTDKVKWISASFIAICIILYTYGKDILAYFVTNRNFIYVNFLLIAILGIGNYFLYTKGSETLGIVSMILSGLFILSWLYLYFIKYKNKEGGETFKLMMNDFMNGSLMCNTIKEIIIHFVTKFAFIIFALYIVFLVYIYHNKTFDFLDTHKTISTFLFTFIGVVLITAMTFSIEGGDQLHNSAGKYFSFLGGMIARMLMIGVALFAAFYLAYSFSKIKNITNFIVSILNVILLIVFLAIVVQYFRNKDGNMRSKSNNFFGFVYNLVTFIPCIFIEFIENLQSIFGDIKREKTMSIIVLIEIIIIGLKFLIPYLSEKIINRGAITLTQRVLPTEMKTPIEVPYYLSESEKPNYNYGISSWVYIHPEPLNTNEAYLENTMLYTFGGMPALNYNAKKNTFVFTMDVIDEKGKKTIIIPGKDINVPLQRWNHVYVNCVEGNFDVFLNGELVLTQPNIIPYGIPRGITVGSEPGIYGELASLVYYKKPLLKDEIKLLYNSLKDQNPPVVV